ncbi:MAG: sulfatase-like hydrolase/transferase [Planctomycetaceae bacterium]|jgi:arylsulfatase|nr:sulfatase-like hydrolase/transferase [Planctomycetaceae bacterium]MBT6154639.1 sulfatase-like hydrolase/transferase [Planctomycetaceae bacterium]MBT6485368.1 sulfatase-like hydrolase/transferase [Planctomycetaceae bacterium]MBT6495123.1 sulfatase-like hydrolase/transferase [Planctomycetaceae bacterium]
MTRPHIIFIITDQQRFDTIRALGYDYVDTPNLDRLVNEGVTFTNCHITAPSCAPSRASLFTGHYPHTTGILRNADRWTRSWIKLIQESGYRTINMGKMHSYPYHTPLGFEERYVVENKDRYLEERFYFDEWDKALRARGIVKQQRELYRARADYATSLGAFTWDLPADTQSDNFVGDMTSWYIRTKPKDDRPLFLQVGFPGPHPPYDPTPDFAEKYMKREFPLLDVTQDELDGQPEPFKKMRVHNSEVDHDSVVHLLNPTHEQRHRQRAYYMANVEMIDIKVGEIMDALEEKGYLENAVVIFTSDHGDCLTDHGHSQKWTMYDTIMRMPLIVWAPGRFSGGRKIDGLCQLMDIGPAILELAGIEVPTEIEAKSLLPAIEGKDWAARDYVYAEHGRDGILQEIDFMSMVRSRDWKLVHFLDSPEGQLFDLQNDPDEVRNLWNDADHIDSRREMLDELREWRIRSGVNAANWAADWR